eukprot:6869792-Prymnesium_polylepis.1
MSLGWPNRLSTGVGSTTVRSGRIKSLAYNCVPLAIRGMRHIATKIASGARASEDSGGGGYP